MVFAFSTEDMVLTPIEESGIPFAVEEDEDLYKAAKLKTTTLANKAEQDMKELASLLVNLKTGTATKQEKNRLASLNAKLDGLTRDLEDSKKMESKAEFKFLQSATRQKMNIIETLVKKKELKSVVRAVCDAECVDLAFVVDCTGSMSAHIRSVKESIKEIVRRVTATNGTSDSALPLLASEE
jgi:hypothetical protein